MGIMIRRIYRPLTRVWTCSIGRYHLTFGIGQWATCLVSYANLRAGGFVLAFHAGKYAASFTACKR